MPVSTTAPSPIGVTTSSQGTSRLLQAVTWLTVEDTVAFASNEAIARLAEIERARKAGLTPTTSIMESLQTLYLAPGPLTTESMDVTPTTVAAEPKKIQVSA